MDNTDGLEELGAVDTPEIRTSIMSEEVNFPVDVFIKIVNSQDSKVLFDNFSGNEKPIKSEWQTITKFFGAHNKIKFDNSSGYIADVSENDTDSISGLKFNEISRQQEEEEEEEQNLPPEEIKRRKWESIASNLSSISGCPRASIPTTIGEGDDKSIVTERLSELRASGNLEPIITSTQISIKEERNQLLSSTRLNETLPLVTNSSSSLTNGGEGVKIESIKMENNNGDHAVEADVVVDGIVKKEEENQSNEKSTNNVDDNDNDNNNQEQQGDQESNQNAPKPRGRKRGRPPLNASSTTDSDNNTSTTTTTNKTTKNTQQQPKRRKANDTVFDTSSNETPENNDNVVQSNSNDKSNPTTTTGSKTVAPATSSSSSLTVTTDSSDTSTSSSTTAVVVEPAVSGSRILDKEEEQLLDTSATLWGCIGIGEWVFARWRDKNYYSGKITEKGMNDTWNIHFEDNMDGVASETHILPIKIIGINVKAVYSPDNIYRPSQAVVVGQKFGEDKEKVEYAIKCHDLPMILCQRKQLSLKESEAKELRRNYQSTLPKAADLSLDNILAGPRRRGVGSGTRKIVGGAFDASTADESLLSSGAGTPTPKKPGPKKQQTSSSMANSSSTPAISSSTSVMSSTDMETSTTVEVPTTTTNDTGYFGTPNSQAHVTVSSTTNNNTTTTSNASPYIPKTPSSTTSGNNVQNNKETPKSGVLKESAKKGKPASEKKLFHGYQFFLTASGGGDPGSSGTGAEAVIPYDKDEYKESIEGKGGKVIDYVGKEKGKDNVFLISDSHARTVKYIYCLAAGIPCVSHLWIGKCLEEESVVDWEPFQLKSGWSLEDERVIPPHQKKPLRGLKVYVTAEQEDLYNYWKPVLLAAEACLLKPKKRPGLMPTETEVLVTDSTCSTELLDLVKEKNIPLVKPEWLVQTIITGNKADFEGHERYSVTPVSMEENGDEEEEDNA